MIPNSALHCITVTVLFQLTDAELTTVRLDTHDTFQSCWGAGERKKTKEEKSHKKRTRKGTGQEREDEQAMACSEAQAGSLSHSQSDGSINSRVSEDLRKVQEENENLKQKLTDIEKTNKNLQSEADKNRKALHSAELRIEELLQEMEQLRNISYVESPLAASDRAVLPTDLETPQINLLDSEASAQLHNQVQRLEKEIRLKDSNFEQLKITMELQLEELRNRNGKLKQDIEGLKAEKDELNNALDDIKKELEKRRNEAEKHEKQSTLLTSEIQTLEQQITVKDEKISNLESLTDKLRCELDDKNIYYIGVLNQRQDDMQRLSDEHRELQNNAQSRLLQIRSKNIDTLQTIFEQLTCSNP
ncbi:unnamed protein product [Enterobius vermicularis]|uniref:GOLGA2L5 domain-containing protein n=1 Tax=Enterobius vermicularis TaxID=51028 RepID=A0A0N4VPI1_ENTVE|nr:unnamed protein product [Enterobius vermicularis]